MKRGKFVGWGCGCLSVFIVLAIIGGGSKTPTSSGTMISPTASIQGVQTSASASATQAAPVPAIAPQEPANDAPVATEAPALTTEVPTAPATTAAGGCYPLTNGGNCYEPGEFCRLSDHGATGVAGDGEKIMCEDNNGWRWEPA